MPRVSVGYISNLDQLNDVFLVPIV
jgi:hypothetical protein